ncbi:MAG: choice-of-anchor D domain-containing protein, partial [Terrimicrobiaceae bacterium]
MQFSKAFSKFILTLASLATVLQPIAATAATSGVFTTRVPMLTSQVSPTLKTINFGAAAVPSNLQTSTTFTNNTGAPLTLDASKFSTTPQAVVLSTNCYTTLAAGASCSLQVGLMVTTASVNSGTISINTGNPAGPDGIVLSATGLAGAPGLISVPASIDFGNYGVGRTDGVPQTVTISNTGTASANIRSVVSPIAAFAVDSTGCALVLEAGRSCTISVKFTPKTLGSASNTTNLRIVLNSGTQLTSTAVRGIGVQGIPKFLPDPAFVFTGLTPNVASPVRSLTVTNEGLDSVILTGFTTTGAGVLFVQGHNCPTSLAPGATCTVQVYAQVPDERSYPSTLRLNYGSGGTNFLSYSVPVRAAFAQASANPTDVNFGDVPRNTTVSQTIEVTNYGTKSMAINAMAATAPFTYSSNCGTTVAPGASCSVTVSVNSPNAGALTGTFTLNADSYGDPSTTVALSANILGSSGYEVSVSELAFGNVALGGTLQKTFTLTNLGSSTQDLSSIQINGASFAQTSACSAVD